MFKVTLSAAANPDYRINSHNGSVQIGQQVKAVASIRQASRACSEFIQENELGGGNWTGGKLFTEEGREIGHISYNGRAWDRNGVEIDLDEGPVMFALKGVKTFPTDDGGAYRGTLVMNGYKVADFRNDGHGGGTIIDYFSEYSGLMLKAYIDQIPLDRSEPKLFPNGYKIDAETLICRLLDWDEELKRLKRYCKKETLFQLHDDDKDSWRTLKTLYDDRAKDWLQKNYGSRVAEVANERFEPIPVPQANPSLGM